MKLFSMFFRFLILIFAILTMVSCQQSTIHPESTVVVKEVRIPKGMPWYSRFASHSFVDYRESSESDWKRLEIVNKSSGIVHRKISEQEAKANRRWGNSVRLVSQSQAEGTLHEENCALNPLIFNFFAKKG